LRLRPVSDERHVKEANMYAIGLSSTPKQLIGISVAFLNEVNKIPLIAKYNSSVLITGETGTGKELYAQRIHLMSDRAKSTFVPVNCGAIPVDLAENELFGHSRGAFTGAVGASPGLIQEADGGTLFLDEIDSLPTLVQVKLLRFLQEKTYRPLGSTKENRADVRVVAATGTNPEELVRAARLRQDLYYRLNVISVVLPPLRERREDIPLLANYFLKKHLAYSNREGVEFSPGALKKLMIHDWPGNVRELEHVVERAVVLSEGNVIDIDQISLPRIDAEDDEESFKEAKERVVTQFEKSYIQKLLMAHHGNISQAAQAAQKHRRAFWQLMRKHGIEAMRA
jgi:two-component system response regulator GlrR